MNLQLFHFIRKESKTVTTKIISASALAGLANGMVVVVINSAAHNYSDFNFRYLLMFVLCIAIYVVLEKYSLLQTAVLVRTAISKAHIGIADKIRHSSLLEFEKIGYQKIYGTLYENAEIVFEASRYMVSSTSVTIMLIFSFLYISYLSMEAFWLSLVIIVCGIGVYLFNQRTTDEELHVSARKESEFFQSLTHLLGGFKELKMNSKKSTDLFNNYIYKISAAARAMRIRSESSFITNIIFVRMFMYLLLASIIFLLPQYTNAKPELIVSLISVLLFVVGPIGFVVDAMPVITKANMAIEKMDALEASLAAADDSAQTDSNSPLASIDKIQQISLKNVSFLYSAPDGQQVFSVGPLDMDIRAGEIIFIVGGNGSGKTTLLKVLTGLYYPHSGVIMCNNELVDMGGYAYYRDKFGVVFSDFHLFERLYGLNGVDDNRVKELLLQMGLNDKTSCVDGQFTNINLSTGQRKRLALVVALMDDKPFYVFDEVAADQDPEFRKYFYEVLLMEMKKEGKTIIAVSHDDRYFHIADRVIKMEYGRII